MANSNVEFFDRDDYPELKKILTLPETYEEWEADQSNRQTAIKASGDTPVVIHVRPTDFNGGQTAVLEDVLWQKLQEME